jgi:hypothetical protein
MDINFDELQKNAEQLQAQQTEQLKAIGVTKIGGKYYQVATPKEESQKTVDTYNKSLDSQSKELDILKKTKDLTTTAKPKMSAGQITTLSDLSSAYDLANESMKLLNDNPNIQAGRTSGSLHRAYKWLGIDKYTDENTTKFDAMLNNLKASFMKGVSGANVTDKEVARLSKFLPDLTDSKATIRVKLNTLLREVNNKKTNLQNTSGSYQPTDIATESSSQTSATADPLGIFK